MFKNFFQTLADNICGYNINKVLEIADIYAQAIDVSVGFFIGYFLLIIVAIWSMICFPISILKTCSFWLDFTYKLVEEKYFYINTDCNK